jgi:hypothetical protein
MSHDVGHFLGGQWLFAEQQYCLGHKILSDATDSTHTRGQEISIRRFSGGFPAGFRRLFLLTPFSRFA